MAPIKQQIAREQREDQRQRLFGTLRPSLGQSNSAGKARHHHRED
jgi:hypothetical protein